MGRTTLAERLRLPNAVYVCTMNLSQSCTKYNRYKTRSVYLRMEGEFKSENKSACSACYNLLATMLEAQKRN